MAYNQTGEAFGGQFASNEVYTDPSQDYSWMEGQAQGQPGHQTQNQHHQQHQQHGHAAFLDPQFQQVQQGQHQQHQGQQQQHHQVHQGQGQGQDHTHPNHYNQYGQEYDTQSPSLPTSASPVPQQQHQHSASPVPQQQQQQSASPSQTPPVAAPGGPPPKFINGEEYHFVPGLGYYPVARIPALRQHQQQAQQAQAQQIQTAAEEPAEVEVAPATAKRQTRSGGRAKPVATKAAPKSEASKAASKSAAPKSAPKSAAPKSAPKTPAKRKLDPTAQAAGAVTAQVSSKRRSASSTDMPEGDFSILEKVAQNPDVADIIRQTFAQLVDQKEPQAKVAFSAARLLLSVSETEWGKTKPDLMALCLSHCFEAFSGDSFHDFWRAMRRFQNFIVRLRAWMVFNVNKRFIDECTSALDFLVVMRLSHDTLLQFKFDKVLKKIIKLGSDSVKLKSNKILDHAAQTVKAEDTEADNKPVAETTKPVSSATPSSVTAAIAAARAKSGKGAGASGGVTKPVAKPVAKPAAAAGSFFKSLSKPEEKKTEVKQEAKAEVKQVAKPEAKEVKDPKEVKKESTASSDGKSVTPPISAKPPPSAFNDVMANILRVPTKRASPVSSGTPVEAKKQKVKKKVSWRPDSELVDVRFFEAEKDENRNHHLSSYRDMDKEEGRGLIGNNSEVDIDFDPVEDEQQPWYEPVGISFEAAVAEEIEPNPPKRGGHGEVESSEAEIMAQRNKTSLATVYSADDEDIPDSPAEPSEASQNPIDLPDSLLSEPKEMVVAERTRKMLGIMSGAYRVVPKHSFKGDPNDENVCEAYDTVFVGESETKPVENKPVATEVPAFDISKLPGFASVAVPAEQQQSTPPPPPPPANPLANPLAALAALPGMQNLIPALQAAVNPNAGAAGATGMPAIPGLPPGVDPMAFVQAIAQMQQQQQQQGQNQQQQHSQQQPRYDRNDRYGGGNHGGPPGPPGNVSDMRKRDVRPEIARAWDKLPANRYSQPCRFFNTDKACSRGDQCIFLHLPR